MPRTGESVQAGGFSSPVRGVAGVSIEKPGNRGIGRTLEIPAGRCAGKMAAKEPARFPGPFAGTPFSGSAQMVARVRGVSWRAMDEEKLIEAVDYNSGAIIRAILARLRGEDPLRR